MERIKHYALSKKFSSTILTFAVLICLLAMLSLQVGALSTSKQIVFIDSDVPDSANIITNISKDAEVINLSDTSDGINQICAALLDTRDLNAIHIISHGAPGTVFLGDSVLSLDTLDQYKTQLKKIGNSLAEGGDILIYGCDVAKGADGRALIDAISKLCNADVAGSDDVTSGDPAKGNNALEVSAGKIDTPVINFNGWEGSLPDSSITIPLNTDTALSSSDLGYQDYGYIYFVSVPGGGSEFGAGASNGTQIQPGFSYSKAAVDSGQVHFKATTIGTYTFQVRWASGNGLIPPYTDAFTITITVPNPAPTGIVLSNSNAPAGYEGVRIGRLTGTDNSGDTNSFSIVSDQNNLFTVSTDDSTKRQGTLSFQAGKTLSAGVSATVTVRVTDSLNQTKDEILTVTGAEPNKTTISPSGTYDFTYDGSGGFLLDESGYMPPETGKGTLQVKDGADYYDVPTYIDDNGYLMSGNTFHYTAAATTGQDTFAIGTEYFVVTVGNPAPVITSGGSASFAENGTGTAYDADATGTGTVTYALSGTDAGLFSINSSTGVVTFNSAPNYESPSDSGGNNVYDFTVTATDDNGSTSQNVAITVTNANEAPTVSSGATASFAENGTGTVYTAARTDPDSGDSVSWSIGGTDAALFNIDSGTGAVIFTAAPNYEAPADNGSDNVYDITVTATDGGSLTDTKSVAITVTDVNEAPAITSGATASFSENGTGTAYAAAATDPESNAFTWSISGTDAALFSIDSGTGAVTFNTPPDFETPTDNGGDNVYDITVTATDSGSHAASLNVAITVTNANEAPTVSSGATASFAENGTGTVYTAARTDPDSGDSVSWSIGGTDAALFNIDSGTGAVTFTAAPNYEAPADNGSDNVYDITVTATDSGSLTDTKSVAITVTDVNEAPAITSGATASFSENGTGTAYAAAATDPESDAFTWSISGTDAALFSIDSGTGAVTFNTPPDFETPTDNGGDNVYDITVTATDSGSHAASLNVAITVTNANEAPTVSSGATASFAENGTGTVYTATRTDPDSGDSVSWSIGGTDAALFNIDSGTGAVTFTAAPNYEAPADNGSDNVYDITVTATDGGGLTDTKSVAITVTDVNEAPAITSGATASFSENGTGTAYAAAATDPESNAFTWSISGTDAALFSIDSGTGAVTFNTPPDFETPTDNGGDNVYDITVTATDSGSHAASLNVAITVTNANEAPSVSSGATASFAENGTGTVYTATRTDPDSGDSVSWSIGGTDAALFNFDSGTGAVTFTAAPNYEAPADNGSDNVYDITVTATDGGGLTDTKSVAITVTDVNEAPAITSGATASFSENGTGTAYAAAATDPESNAFTWSISGTDAALFSIDSGTGAVTFNTPPDFETPTDNGGDNVYDITVTATDSGSHAASLNVAITVTNANEAPSVSSGATASFAENGTGTVYTATRTDPDSGDSVSWSIGGTDAALFNFDSGTGAVTFAAAPNYEAPADNGSDNVYDITVTATDGGGLTDTKSVAITVTNVNEAPAITSGATANFAENGTGTAYTAAATDPESDAFTWSISGTDAALFSIDSGTGAVTFNTPPDFETPADNGGDNVYDITVTATDSGSHAVSLNVAITVTKYIAPPPYIGGGSTSGSDTGSTGSTDTNVEVNGDSYSAGTSETGTNASGQTVTTVTVDTDKLQDILENQGQGATVTIPVATGSTVASGVLTGDMVDTMEQNGATLVIDTGSATYTLPAEEININAVSEQLGENVSLGDITVTVSVFSPSDDMVTVVENTAENGGYTLVVPAVEFTVSCSYGEQTVDVTSFDTYVDRTIIIPDGVDPNQITTAIVVDPDGTTHSVPTNVFLTEEGLYAVRIRSLTNSVYTVIYNPVEFPDVENHWARDAINDMGSRMIVTGDLNGSFNPDNSITRAEFAAIMVRALGLAPGDGTNRFSDVVSSSWYCGYVKTATAYGIITGYDDGTFRPNDLITREQAMTMLARAMTITGLAPDVDAGAVLLNFNDGNTISNYAKDGVAACIETGVVTGKTAEMLAPKDSVTRAEVAVMVQRLLVQSGLI